MELRFTAGQDERYTVHFQHDKVLAPHLDHGRRISVLKRNKPFEVSFDLVKRHSFQVGPAGRHQVVIEVERRLLLAGLRQMRYRAFVDDALVAARSG